MRYYSAKPWMTWPPGYSCRAERTPDSGDYALAPHAPPPPSPLPWVSEVDNCLVNQGPPCQAINQTQNQGFSADRLTVRGKEPHAEEQSQETARSLFPQKPISRVPLPKTTLSSRSAFVLGQSCKPKETSTHGRGDICNNGTNHAR